MLPSPDVSKLRSSGRGCPTVLDLEGLAYWQPKTVAVLVHLHFPLLPVKRCDGELLASDGTGRGFSSPACVSLKELGKSHRRGKRDVPQALCRHLRRGELKSGLGISLFVFTLEVSGIVDSEGYSSTKSPAHASPGSPSDDTSRNRDAVPKAVCWRWHVTVSQTACLLSSHVTDVYVCSSLPLNPVHGFMSPPLQPGHRLTDPSPPRTS